MQAGTAAFFILVSAVALAAVVAGVLAAALGFVVAAIFAVGYGIAGAVDFIVSNFDRVIKYALFLPSAFYDAGASIAHGIANGIRSGIGDAISAMKELALRPLQEFKARMGIHSPSRLAFAVSANVPKGTALAYRAGIPEVKSSARQMAEATEDGMRAGSKKQSAEPPETRARLAPPAAAEREPLQRGGARQAPAAPTINMPIAEGAINVHGVSDPAAAAHEIIMQVEERIINVARQLGALETP